MTSQSQRVLEDFQVRKSVKEKKEFRAWLQGELEAAGYPVTVEGSFFAGHNVIAGDPEGAEVLLTAHYDTQAVLPFPNFITPRNFGVYLLYNVAVCLGFFILASLAGGIALSLPLPWYVKPWLPMGMCIFCMWWLFFGKANRHTVNDNTSGVLTLLETALTMPAEDREKVCFVFFDNEERGMLGSSHFAKAHKAARRDKLVLNFDCVSDGDYIQFYPETDMKRKDRDTLDRLERAFPSGEGKTAEVVRGFGFYPSDNKCFKRGVGVCALKKNKLVGYYMDRIHTARDTVLDEENLRFLRDGVLRVVEQAEAYRR